jgi:hypothetical protein
MEQEISLGKPHPPLHFWLLLEHGAFMKLQTKPRGHSPQANYTDRAIAAYRRS